MNDFEDDLRSNTNVRYDVQNDSHHWTPEHSPDKSGLLTGLRRIGSPVVGALVGVRNAAGAAGTSMMSVFRAKRKDSRTQSNGGSPYKTPPYSPGDIRLVTQQQQLGGASGMVSPGMSLRMKPHRSSTKQLRTGGGGGGGNGQAAAPKVVQDMLRCLPLMRCFAPCIRPPGRRMRGRAGTLNLGKKVRRGSAADTNAVGMSGGGGLAGADGAADFSGLDGMLAGHGGQKPVYIQVHGARRLVWPMVEGATQHAAYCQLSVTSQQHQASGYSGGGLLRQVTTKTIALPSGSTSPQWNEVFCFNKGELLAGGGVVQVAVWGQDSYGDDFLIGQGELVLGALLKAAQPAPMALRLTLSAPDDEGGDGDQDVVYNACGELAIAAWVERDRAMSVIGHAGTSPLGLPQQHPAAQHAAQQQMQQGTYSQAGLAPDADGAANGSGYPGYNNHNNNGNGAGAAAANATQGGAAAAAAYPSPAWSGGVYGGAGASPGQGAFGGPGVGVVTSSLDPPCGTKVLPLVYHSPLGTLYEEPCVMYLRIQVSALRDISSELLMSAAANTTSRRVKLKQAAACAWAHGKGHAGHGITAALKSAFKAGSKVLKGTAVMPGGVGGGARGGGVPGAPSRRGTSGGSASQLPRTLLAD